MSMLPPFKQPDPSDFFYQSINKGLAEAAGSTQPYVSGDATTVEYIIVALGRNKLQPTIFLCGNAKEMHDRTNLMKQDPSWVTIFIFKKMLQYSAKVEWEAVSVDA